MYRLVIAVGFALGLGAIATPARADYGRAADVRDVRTAEFASWTAFGKNVAQTKQAISVDDVTVAGDYALVSFTAGDLNGQSLLQNQRGLWVKIAQTGGIYSVVNLRSVMPADLARELALHNAVTQRNERFLLGKR